MISPARPSETVRLDADCLTINTLVVSEPRTVGYFRTVDADHLESAARKAIIAGAVMLSGIKHTTDLSYVENQVRDLLCRVEGALQTGTDAVIAAVDARFDPRIQSSHSARLSETVNRTRAGLVAELQGAVAELRRDQKSLSEDLSARFDPNRKNSYLANVVAEIDAVQAKLVHLFDGARSDSIPGRLREQLDALVGNAGVLDALLDRKLSLSDPSSPIFKIASDLETLKAELHKQQAVAVLTEKTPIKGIGFEADVESVLNSLAAHHVGDTVADVRNLDSKKGDYLYVLAEGPCIGIEARDRKITSAIQVRETLDTVMKERQAAYAIYVVSSSDQLQAQMGTWDEYDGNKAVTSLDMLDVAIKFARIRLQTVAAQHDAVDVAGVADQLRSIRESLKRLGQIKTDVRKSERALGDATKNIQRFESDLTTAIRTAEALLKTPQQPSAA